jgi:hypothetical protein
MGALPHPLYQNDNRMIEAGIFTREKYNEASEELLDWITQYYEKTSSDDSPVAVKTNKWDKSTYLDGKQTPLWKAKTELNAYQAFMDPMYHSEMKPYKMLCAYNESSGDSIEPVYI